MRKILCFLLFTGSLISCEAQHKQTVALVPPTEFSERMTNDNGQVIDVRTPKEYQAGHIENAVNLHVYDADFEQRVEKLDKEEPVYVYCKAGGRSAEAVEVMKAKGFQTIVELEGGMDAWNEAGKPVKQ